MNKQKVAIYSLLLIGLIFYLLWNNTNNNIDVVSEHSFDNLVKLSKPSPNGNYYITTSDIKNKNQLKVTVHKTNSKNSLRTFIINGDSQGNVQWFKDSNHFIFSHPENSFVYNIQLDQVKNIPISGYSTTLSPDETFLATIKNGEVIVFNLKDSKITTRIKFPKNQLPKILLSWNENGFPEYVGAEKVNEKGKTILKINKDLEISDLDLQIAGFILKEIVHNRFAVYNNSDLYFRSYDEHQLNHLDFDSEKVTRLSESRVSTLVSLNPSGDKIGSFQDGINIYDNEGKLLYEKNTGDSELVYWKWLNNDKFVIVYRKLKFTGLFGEKNLIEIHDLSKKKVVAEKEIDKPYSGNIYFSEENRNIFIQTSMKKMKIYKLSK